MKNNATLIIVGLVGLIIGAVVAYLVFGPVKPLADPGPARASHPEVQAADATSPASRNVRTAADSSRPLA